MDPKTCKNKLWYISPPKTYYPRLNSKTYIYHSTPTIKFKIQHTMSPNKLSSSKSPVSMIPSSSWSRVVFVVWVSGIVDNHRVWYSSRIFEYGWFWVMCRDSPMWIWRKMVIFVVYVWCEIEKCWRFSCKNFMSCFCVDFLPSNVIFSFSFEMYMDE